MSAFVIAEAGVNHNGDPQRALEMVEAAAAAGADAVKFQTFTASKLVTEQAEKAEYQKRETGGGSQHEMLEALEMSEALHHRLFERCEQAGIEFMSTPFDEDAADFLIALGMKRLKVPSGEIVNYRLLRHLAAKRRPMIVSTGMATLAEVEDAVRVVRDAWGSAAPAGDAPLTILHCTSNYPAPPAEANLRAMTTMAESLHLPVGYSDHTLGIVAAIAAVARGATVIEKHFTLDRGLEGPDHAASLTAAELGEMIAAIREVDILLGSPVKAPTDAELAVRAVARRSVIATRDLDPGTIIALDDINLLRPAGGIPAKDFDAVIGRRVSRGVRAGSQLAWDDLQ